VKVLSVFGKRETLGNATIIEIDKDWEALKKLLSEDTNAALVRLVEPTLDELCDEIDQQRPQILFFAGHSRTEEEEEVGFIELNPHEPSITIDDLEPDLRKAVKRGLQLVIFNSCDGLGIARQLAALEIPNIIIMREPVPDEVAYKFLQRFLEVFAQGKPLHLAVRRAREKINRLENKFPGATWLPMTFQNPAEPPLTWSLLGGLTIGNSQGTEESQILWIPTQIGSSSNPLTEDTITCSSCQTQNPNDAKFCYKCGYNLNQQVLEITCINGHVNLGTNNFCIYCGVSLQLLETVITSPVTEILGEEIKPEVVICNNCGYENTSTDKFCLLCGSLISEDLENKQPQTIPATINFPDTQSIQTLLNNRYRIIQTLGTGGFSKTFFAEDTYKPSHPRCVIKQLRILTNYNAQAHRLILERFQREAAVLEELGDGCNQIPKLYAYFSEEGQFYLVQEFIEGQTLSEIVNQDGRLNEGAVKEILINTLPVLQYVHDKGIIHRDIKPDNIILRLSDRKPVLIDFGAVKEIISSEYIIEGSTIAIGTPGFSSPEQLMGRPTFASDLYSLGLTAIYLLTGERPQSFQTGETGDLMWKRNLPRLNSTFAEILDKTIKYNPQERYQSATEMLIALSSSTLNT
jgi:serine/threonine-protein kinase